jgi:predicted ferric reductase
MENPVLSRLAPGVAQRIVALGVVALVHAAMWALALSVYGLLVAPIQIFAEMLSSLALVLVSCNLVLATRASVLERSLTGLDKLFVTHRFIGLSVGAIITMHFLIVPKTPGWVPSKLIGYPLIASLLIMIFVASAPRFPWARLVPLPYQWWKAIHRLNGLFVVAIVAHSLYAPAFVHRAPLLAGWVYGMATIGFLAWLYRELLFAKLGPFRDFVVAGTRPIGDVLEITLGPPTGAGGASSSAVLELAHPRRAGQFACVTFDQGPTREQHPFTISSGPAAAPRFSIKDSGDFTHAMHRGLPTGSAVRVEGPYGAFTYHRGRADQVWLAGGIGITPFLSMAADLDADTNVLLVWSVRTTDEAIYDDELERIALEKPNLSYVLHVTSEQGHLDLGSLRPSASIAACSVFLCGPLPMRREFLRQLLALKVPRREIYYEEFRLR